jgi:mono/diheme cytochrome c family protein
MRNNAFIFTRFNIALTLLVGAIAIGRDVAQGQQPGGSPSAVNGKAMFETYCTACHGKEGKGDGPAAAALKTKPADLTGLSARNGGTFPTDKVRRFIEGRETVAGHGTREMPIWGGLFTGLDRDSDMARLRIANLSDYLKTIQK